MRLIQLLGEGIEELWEFPDDITDEEIKEVYKTYQNHPDYEESFEEYLEEYNPQMQGERKFVDEIYI